jgi:predicted ester cyclase
MPADLKQTVQRLFDEVVNGGDLDLAEELLHPDFVGHTPQGDLDVAGFKNYVEFWRASFPDITCTVSDLIQEGDRIAWRVRASGTHDGEFMGIPATGRRIEFDSMNQARAIDGRPVEHTVLMDDLSMLRQLGALPDSVPA